MANRQKKVNNDTYSDLLIELQMRKYLFLIIFLTTSCTQEKTSTVDEDNFNRVGSPVNVISSINDIDFVKNRIEISFKLFNKTSKPVKVYRNTMNISSFYYEFSHEGKSVDVDGSPPMAHSLPIFVTIKPKENIVKVINIINIYPSLVEIVKAKSILLKWKTSIPVLTEGGGEPIIYQFSGQTLLKSKGQSN